MKKHIRVIPGIILLFFTLICLIQPRAYAADLTEWITDAKEFSSGEVEQDENMVTMDKSKLEDVSHFVSGLLLGISIVVAVITTAVLGLSFIVETAEGKAKVKEALIPLVVGMVISFGAFTIWRFVIGIFV